MPTRRACVAALIPAVVVFGIFGRWLDFRRLSPSGSVECSGSAGSWSHAPWTTTRSRSPRPGGGQPHLADLDSLSSDTSAPAVDDPVTQGGRPR